MGGLDPRVAATLETLSPPRPAPDRWNAVVASAMRTSRVLLRTAAVAAVAAAALAVALAWPFGGGPRGTVLERALAAVGDGPVLHVVLRDEWGGTLVDLRTGERRRIHGERELWYDPKRGIHEVSSFAGVPQGDALYPPGRVRFLDKTLHGLATGYRRALEDGTARVLGTDVVDGRPVYWIRVDAELLPDVADGRDHEWAHDVAVSRETFEPVATRETRDGVPGPDTGATILRVESLPEGAGDFTAAPEPNWSGVSLGLGAIGSLTPAQASEVLGRRALWPGRSVDGVQLAGIAKTEGRQGYDRKTRRWAKTHVGVTFSYGAVEVPGRSTPGRYVQLSETTELYPGFQRGVLNYSPPEGSVLVFGGHIGVMQRDGLYLALEASDVELLLAAARALEPVPG